MATCAYLIMLVYGYLLTIVFTWKAVVKYVYSKNLEIYLSKLCIGITYEIHNLIYNKAHAKHCICYNSINARRIANYVCHVCKQLFCATEGATLFSHLVKDKINTMIGTTVS